MEKSILKHLNNLQSETFDAKEELSLLLDEVDNSIKVNHTTFILAYSVSFDKSYELVLADKDDFFARFNTLLKKGQLENVIYYGVDKKGNARVLKLFYLHETGCYVYRVKCTKPNTQELDKQIQPAYIASFWERTLEPFDR